MKKFIVTLALFAVLVLQAAVSTTYDLWFIWKANPPSESVLNYVIEKATAPNTNSFIPVVTISSTTNVGVVKGLTPGTYRFRLVAKNGVGSSLPSNILNYPTNAPSTAAEFNFTVPR